jgi:DNA end-binding protein Ku
VRAIWKGAVSFGLVNIPVKLYSATEDRDVSFHQVHATDGGRVRYRRVCSTCGDEVAYADLAKGYELDSGDMVMLSDADLAELPLPTAKTVELLAFVPAEQLDPVAFSKPYYLEPDKTGAKPYTLLRDELRAAGRVGLVKVAIRNRESLAVLRPRDDVLVLQTMVWPDEVREAEFESLDDTGPASPAEHEIARTLIETMAGDFDPTEHRDAYRDAVNELVEAKAAGGEVKAAEPAPEATPVVDLVAALKASVEAAKKARSSKAVSDSTDSPRRQGASRQGGRERSAS